MARGTQRLRGPQQNSRSLGSSDEEAPLALLPPVTDMLFCPPFNSGLSEVAQGATTGAVLQDVSEERAVSSLKGSLIKGGV